MPKIQIDTVAVAEALRPSLMRISRELRREARAVGVSPEQVSLLVAIKYEPGIGVRELAARERVSPAGDVEARRPARARRARQRARRARPTAAGSAWR